MPARLKVLVACEFSGIVREAFNRLGHHAWSVDLLGTEIPGFHHQGDALEMVAADDWDLIVAHPPCTYLTNSGVQWLFLPWPENVNLKNGQKKRPGRSLVRDEARWADMRAGAAFFAALYHAKSPRVAVENPVMHGHAMKELAALGVPSFTQSIQPYQFGHLETKRTCLWLRGLAPLVGTDDVEAAMRRLPKSKTNLVHLASPGPDRWLLRSRTYPGIAEAMAHQWGGRVTHKTVSFSQPATLPHASGPARSPAAL